MARHLFIPLCIAALVAMTASPASALVRLGIKGGLNIASISDIDDNEIKAESDTDFVGGAFVRFGLGKALLQVEGLYSKRNAKLQGEDDGVPQTVELTQNFVEIPVLVHYALLQGLISPKIYAGASASWESSCDVTAEGDVSGDCSELLGANTDKTYWAGVVGAVLDVNVTVVGFLADVRYNYGFTSLSDDGNGKWRYWSIMVGVSIGLGT